MQFDSSHTETGVVVLVLENAFFTEILKYKTLGDR